MHSQMLSPQALALLDTGKLARPSREIDAWLKSEQHWAVALYREHDICIGLLLAIQEQDEIICTALAISMEESEDTLTYRLIHTLCQHIPHLEPDQLRARLPQTNKGIVEALNVMGVVVAPTRSAPITVGPTGHFAA